MRASETRRIMEAHLTAFFEASPGDRPADLKDGVSPLWVMRLKHGLSVESARRYVQWLQGTSRVSGEQAAALHQLVNVTEHALEQFTGEGKR